jgi:hypothetical protein
MTDVRITVGIVAAVGVAIGLGLVSLLRGNSDEPHPSPVLIPSNENAASIGGELAACRDDLALERRDRIALQKTMEGQIDALRKQLAQSRSKPASPKPPEKASQQTADAKPGDPFTDIWFSEGALLELGIDPEEVARLRDRFEALEVVKRELEDRATREGWRPTGAYGSAVLDMYAELREEVGDEDYDNILYASGQSNRIETERVLGESTADNAGIRPGDRIISYAGKRIFDESSLITLTAGGEAGENTRVEVLRDGEIVYLIVPRGPLGIKFAVIRVPPGS